MGREIIFKINSYFGQKKKHFFTKKYSFFICANKSLSWGPLRFSIGYNPLPRNFPSACFIQYKQIQNTVFANLLAGVFKLLTIF